MGVDRSTVSSGRALDCIQPGLCRSPEETVKVYIIGSMQNATVLEVGAAVRAAGHDAFDDWHSSGPESDLHWHAYEQKRGRTFRDALKGHHAQNVYRFDKGHIDESDAGVLVLPAGRSGHLELGYMVGRGKRTCILLADPNPERFDIMYNFAEYVATSVEEVVAWLAKEPIKLGRHPQWVPECECCNDECPECNVNVEDEDPVAARDRVWAQDYNALSRKLHAQLEEARAALERMTADRDRYLKSHDYLLAKISPARAVHAANYRPVDTSAIVHCSSCKDPTSDLHRGRVCFYNGCSGHYE